MRRPKTLHGETHTRLYKCWSHMIERAKKRVDCLVCDEWQTYVGFRNWSLDNGYSDNLVLCRNGDTGNYQPDNARWDTPANNKEEAQAKHYKFVLEGKLVEVYNLSKYSKENKLNVAHMCAVHNGKRKSHKGYTKWLDTNPSA